MSQFLFLIGIGLLVIGKVNFGSIKAEGNIVRGAGTLLMLPFVSVLFIAQMLRMLNDGELDLTSTGTLLFLLVVDIGSMVICIYTAYMMLKNDSPQAEKPAPKPRIERPAPAPRPQQQRGRSREFPTLMGIAEAAHYLNVSEQDVMSLINEGKITAARINYQYRIARSVLDDYMSGNAEA